MKPPKRPKPLPKPPRKAQLATAVRFGDALRKARIKADVTQSDLAKMAGFNAATKIPGVEKGTTDLRLSTAERLADALGVALSDLLKK